MASPLFEFEAVTVERGGRTLLDAVTAEVPDDGVTVVVGPSGAGKSTLLRLCNRLEVPTSGRVRHRGEDVAGCDPLALRRRVGTVFQRPTPLPGSVADNLRIGTPDAPDADVDAVLDEVGLTGLATRDAGELSGGEAQRMCLARTLLTHPTALLFDEPTSALDPASARVVEALATRLARTGTPVLWVSHDLDQVGRIADHLVVLIGGRVAQAGPYAEVVADPVPDVRRFLAGGTARRGGERGAA